ncbi:heme-binding protein [Corallococcus exercitus]|uniref:Heme-binding protein n=1 Tax=Corallococcus exercitus TaxID=2316736 RepID=A0A7Y4JZN8_9BACT|nr:heme-binding protein [Corallococcus exercitus]NOK13728.1 heme-binding protein [Corallococcus exercitus]
MNTAHSLIKSRAGLLAALLPALGAAAGASPSPPPAALDLDTAERLAHAARAQCAALGKEIAVAVVDAGGQALLQSRSASVGPHNLEAARRKAFTSLSTRQPTLQLGRQARSQPDTAGLQYLPELLLLGGGQPLRRGGTVIGAIGVAGGGGPENDDACALAAARTLQP